jgi:hypothetical protein
MITYRFVAYIEEADSKSGWPLPSGLSHRYIPFIGTPVDFDGEGNLHRFDFRSECNRKESDPEREGTYLFLHRAIVYLPN